MDLFVIPDDVQHRWQTARSVVVVIGEEEWRVVRGDGVAGDGLLTVARGEEIYGILWAVRTSARVSARRGVMARRAIVINADKAILNAGSSSEIMH